MSDDTDVNVRRARFVVLDPIATPENYDEQSYLDGNPDVAQAVREGRVESGKVHFNHYGLGERRKLRVASQIEPLRRQKMAKVEMIISQTLPYSRESLKYNYLTAELIKETGIILTDAVSANDYDFYVTALIDEFSDGLILDCGAGRRSVYYDNVINYEIVDYDTTDVLGVGEKLPFLDNSVDGVISIAVLEHVRDPFACAREITRVLKPGGKLVCCVPFLQPEHGYPHHYFNMAPQGLRALFERILEIDDHKVIASTLPVWSLWWIAQSWADGLTGQAKIDFTNTTLGDLIEAKPRALLDKNWVKELSVRKNFELASGTLLFAHKPSAGSR